MMWLKFLMMNFYYQIERFVIEVAEKYDKKGKKLLDVGAEGSRYKKYFKKVRYYSQDVEQNEVASIDFVGDLNAGLKGVKAASFDYILCTQVLEHLQKPAKVFEEFNRLLKPGGRLFLTTNFLYQIHMAPNDYYRFTEHGLKYLGESSGFKVEHLKSQGGVFSVLSYVVTTLPIRLWLKEGSFMYLLYLVVFSPVIIGLNLLAFSLDRLDNRRQMTINYEVIYRKADVKK